MLLQCVEPAETTMTENKQSTETLEEKSFFYDLGLSSEAYGMLEYLWTTLRTNSTKNTRVISHITYHIYKLEKPELKKAQGTLKINKEVEKEKTQIQQTVLSGLLEDTAYKIIKILDEIDHIRILGMYENMKYFDWSLTSCPTKKMGNVFLIYKY